MRNSEKRTQRKARAAADRAGGDWGDGIRARLRALMESRGENQAQFAKTCGIQSPRVTDWIAGNQLPSLARLKDVGEATLVSLDWLLFGDGGEEPRLRGETMSKADFAADLKNRVIHDVDAAARREPFRVGSAGQLIGGSGGWTVDAAAILRDAVEREIADMRAWCAWEGGAGVATDRVSQLYRAFNRSVANLPLDDAEQRRNRAEFESAAKALAADAHRNEKPRRPHIAPSAAPIRTIALADIVGLHIPSVLAYECEIAIDEGPWERSFADRSALGFNLDTTGYASGTTLWVRIRARDTESREVSAWSDTRIFHVRHDETGA